MAAVHWRVQWWHSHQNLSRESARKSQINRKNSIETAFCPTRCSKAEIRQFWQIHLERKMFKVAHPWLWEIIQSLEASDDVDIKENLLFPGYRVSLYCVLPVSKFFLLNRTDYWNLVYYFIWRGTHLALKKERVQEYLKYGKFLE